MRTSFEFINRSERIVKFLCANSWELHKLNFSLRMLQPILSKGSLLLFAIHKWIKDVISIALQFHRLLSMLSGKCSKSTWIGRLLLPTNILLICQGVEGLVVVVAVVESGSSLDTFLAHSDLVTQSGKGRRGARSLLCEKIYVAILPSYWNHYSQLKRH